MLIDELQGLVTFGASRDASITRTKVGAYRSLRASSPFGGYHEKWTRERHARRDAKASGGGGGGGGGRRVAFINYRLQNTPPRLLTKFLAYPDLPVL